MRKSGIEIVGDIPWGTHIAQFYVSKTDLVDILVPYFKTGLENNEYCMWVTSDPIGVDEAKAALRKRVHNFDDYLKNKQIEILDSSHWYTKRGRFESERALEGWAKKENEALKRGFDGLRVTGNISWLDNRDWKNFADYEAKVTNIIDKHKMIAICSYSLDKCGAAEAVDVASHHQFALVKKEGNWTFIENSEHRQKEKSLSETNARLQILQQVTEAVHSTLDLERVFKQITDGFVYSMGYTTAIIIKLSDERKYFEIKTISAKKRPQIDKILGFSLKNFSIPADPGLNPAVKSVMKGKVVIVKTLAEILYPLINKKACSALQRLRGTKNYIIVPLENEKEVIGGVFVSSSREEVSEEELNMIKSFAHAASSAIKNAKLHLQTTQAEEALKESEERFRKLSNVSMEGIVIHEKGEILDANQAFARIFGYKLSELIGINVLELAAPESRDLVLKNILSGYEKPYEAKGLRKDGSIIVGELCGKAIPYNGRIVRVTTIRELTWRKKAEERLKLEKARLDQLYESAQEGIVMTDKEGRVMRVNNEFVRLFGYMPEEVKGRNVDELVVPKKEFDKGMSITRKVAGGKNFAFEAVRQHKDGRLIEVSILASPIIVNGNVIAAYAIYRDITERKKAEERILRQSAVLNAINKVFRETLICETEEEVARTCLAVAEELTGSQFGFIGKVNEQGRLDTIAQSDTGWEACKIPRSDAVLMINDMEIRGIWGKVIKDEQSLIVNDPSSHPSRVGTPKGHPLINAFLGVPLKEAEKTIGMIALANKKSGYDLVDKQAIEDLSIAFLEVLKRKRAEEAIKIRKSQLELVHRIQNDIPMNMDIETILATAAESIGKSFGYSKASVNLFDEDTKELVHLLGWNKSGTPTPRGHRQKIGEGMIGTAAELKRTIVANDVSKEPSYVAYYQAEIKSELTIPLIVQDHLVGVLDIQDINKDIFTKEDVFVLQSIASYIAYVIDEKQTEEALRASEEKYRFLVDNSKEIILILSKKGKIVFANKSAMTLYGYSEDELIGKSIIHFLAKDCIKKALYALAQEFLGRPQAEMEVRVKTKSGEIRYLEVARGSTPVYDKSKLIGVMISASDITERKKAEKVQASLYKISEAARAAENLEELYRLIHNTISDLMPAKNFYIALYDEVSEMFNFPYFIDEYEGNPGPQKLGKGLTEYVLRTGKPLLASPEVFDKLEKKGKVESVGPPSIDWLGVPLRTNDRTIGVLTVQSYTEGVRYSEEDKNILTFISEQVAMAIERKQAEEVLRESEEKYRIQFEEALDAIFIADAETGIIINCNNAASKLVGRAKSELVGKHQRILHPPEEIRGEFSRTFKSHLKEKEGQTLEAQVITKDGERKDVAIKASLFEFRGMKLLQGIFRDITERKQAEEKIKASLREKEVMLREIHHRVKNNMQIISSLLRLQARQFKNKKIRDSFNVSQNRIRSMVLIHESLYQANDLARINFSEYIKKLAIHLFSIYRTGKDSIDLKVEVGNVFLDINRAIPCGLIINELVSNSLKHAFPDDRKGEIAVNMDMDKRGKYTLIVKDTGIGLPEGADFKETETLGMQLVTDLVKQLNGNIELKGIGGAEFRIVF